MVLGRNNSSGAIELGDGVSVSWGSCVENGRVVSNGDDGAESCGLSWDGEAERKGLARFLRRSRRAWSTCPHMVVWELEGRHRG
jgi:hypothetical protein